MTVKILPSRAKGTVKAPPSKSMAHRLLICAGMADGESTVRGISASQDVLATIECLQAMGVSVKFISDDKVKVKGVDFNKACPTEHLNCRESGSTIRFFVPLTALCGKEIFLNGAPTLLKRPMDVYQKLSEKHGFKFVQNESGITVCGPLKAGTYTVPGNISSQFITGLLLALPQLKGDSEIDIIPPIESQSYLNLTLSAMECFGVKIEKMSEYNYKIKGGQKFIPQNVTVEGDFSNAAFLDGFNVIGGEVEVQGLDGGSLQGDKVYKDIYRLLESNFPIIDISDCPDLGPVLFALATVKNGAVFEGTKRLRIKESDRVAAMQGELSKLGVNMISEDNRVIIPKSEIKVPTENILGHNDHRIVMAMTLLLSIVGGTIEGAEAVNKSFPDFFSVIKSLGTGVFIDA